MAKIKVSDHAIIRYFERVLGLDLTDIKNELSSDRINAMYSKLGDGKYPVSQGTGVRAIVVNNTVVSVVKC